MIAQHHAIVNQVRIRKRKPRRNITRIQQLRNSTNYCLARIKRPLLALKERVVKKQVFSINTNIYFSAGGKTDAEIIVVDTTHRDSFDEPASKANTPITSLDPRTSNLPIEVRLKIWRMCWEPRVVEVHPYVNNRELDELAPFESNTYRSTARPPVTLHICSESRIETLNHYYLVFAARGKYPEVYFNFDLDCLYVREADMFRGPSFATTFSTRDLKRVRRLAITDCYIQHLVGERQRSITMQNDSRPLACFLLQSKLRNHMWGLNVWESLEQLDIVIDDMRKQQDDRVCSWIKEGIYVCAHCVLMELKTSFNQWPGGPRLNVYAYSSCFRRVKMHTDVPELSTIIQRDGHLILTPCCRLRPAELLESLRKAENPPGQLKWVTFMRRIFGLRIMGCPDDMPCRCRLENYILSKDMSPYASRFIVYNRNDGGELGQLCKKWLQYTEFKRH